MRHAGLQIPVVVVVDVVVVLVDVVSVVMVVIVVVSVVVVVAVVIVVAVAVVVVIGLDRLIEARTIAAAAATKVIQAMREQKRQKYERS